MPTLHSLVCGYAKQLPISVVSHLVSGCFIPLNFPSVLFLPRTPYLPHQPQLLWEEPFNLSCSGQLSPALWSLSGFCSPSLSLARPGSASEPCSFEVGLHNYLLGLDKLLSSRDSRLFILVSQAPRTGLAHNRHPRNLCLLKEWKESFPKIGKYLTI